MDYNKSKPRGGTVIQHDAQSNQCCCSHGSKSHKMTLDTNVPIDTQSSSGRNPSSSTYIFVTLDTNVQINKTAPPSKTGTMVSQEISTTIKDPKTQQTHGTESTLGLPKHTSLDRCHPKIPSLANAPLRNRSLCPPISIETKKKKKTKPYQPQPRHIRPQIHSPNHRATTYTDLIPFEINQLTKILSYHPDPNTTPPDSPSWENYSNLTKPLISALSPTLQARLVFPGFRPHDLCHLHRKLNPKPLRHMLSALQYEIEVRKPKIWNPVIDADGLSHEQLRLLDSVDGISGLWLTKEQYLQHHGTSPKRGFSRQNNGCVACILSRVGGKADVATALGALMLGAMKRGGIRSSRVLWCKEWVRNAVVGSLEEVEREMGRMDGLGDGLREVRKRWRGGKRGQGDNELQGMGEEAKGGDILEDLTDDDEEVWGLSCAAASGSEARLDEDTADSIIEDRLFKHFTFSGATNTTTTTIIPDAPEPPSPSIYSTDSGYASCLSPFSSTFK